MYSRTKTGVYMNRNYQNNGYLETIQNGLSGVRSFREGISYGSGSREERIVKLRKEINEADAILIGVGSGLSTSAGLTYSGERFERYFYDFVQRYGITDMYSGGFYPFEDDETYWAWWSRHIYYNRYIDAPKPVYKDLLKLLEGKDYFIITTNVDHQFQRAGFDKKKLFYTQGDYGLLQSVEPAARKTYDNEDLIMRMMEGQGFVKDENNVYQVPENRHLKMTVPRDLLPVCPDDGKKMIPNLRTDDTFVEDEGWHRASNAYFDFLRRHERLHVLFMEIGVGNNTPVIIKYPFWTMVNENEKAVYACLNYDEAYCPRQIEERSICIDGDTGEVLKELLK